MAETTGFEAHLKSSWPLEAWRDVTVVVAISGGADSVALLRGLLSVRGGGAGRIVASHFNHRLRGADSDGDQQFVEELCCSLGVACEIGQAAGDFSDSSDAAGLESRARQARYEFLTSAANRCGARYVATAHTADDQAETILHRIVRGTGIAGLSGIPSARPLTSTVTIVRPLLGIRRGEVLAYLDSLGQTYRQDHSNFDPRFTRNRIRLELLPSLARDYNPNVVEALLRLGQLAGEAQSIIDSLVDQLISRVVTFNDPQIVLIDCAPVRGQPKFLQRELVKTIWRRQSWPEQAMAFEHWDKLAGTIASDARIDEFKTSYPGDIMAEKKGGQLSLTRP